MAVSLSHPFQMALVDGRRFHDPTVRCQDTHDCDAHHICLNQTCLPQLLRGEECDPLTGDWTLVSIQGKSLVACICKYPDFIHQKHYGGIVTWMSRVNRTDITMYIRNNVIVWRGLYP
ncbi:uncharacterized protein TNCT_311401 [Trichonephila clavata]|uniref:Uncharacterized protein n=1 Tax=Trichonephila clavata TaxID=2740835 RepID=A0A8X6FN61_TRICU|nr:uncharacterized protein TNCT_311401 [Trichonephila clavata]